jgi:hypothetical protein
MNSEQEWMRMPEKKNERFVKACPRCFSTDVTMTDRPALAAYREFYYRCRKCGLEAKLFPEFSVADLEKVTEKKSVRKNA